MELLDFLITWGTNVFAISTVALTVFGFVSVAKKYLERKSVSE